MKRFLMFVMMLMVVILNTFGQNSKPIKGYVVDKATGERLYSATVSLKNQEDLKKVYNMVTGYDGEFYFPKVAIGNYKLEVAYLGYKTRTVKLNLHNEKLPNLSPIELSEDVVLLGSVEVTGRATRAEQRGDSLIYNADAFKVMQGSSAEELLAKMPGIVVEGGTVQAQGESVRKIFVDGKEFFDGDINLAIKNLPSDIIASIEVFDKMSEQSEFTGFDDGESIKTINIVTKSGFTQGTFGKVYGGYGTEDRYNAGGNINFFDGERRISVLGMANNVNNQNFSQEDVAGVMSSTSNSGRGRKGGGGGGGGKGGGGKGGGGKGGSGSSNASDFMVGEMGGITTSSAIGLNYVDSWSQKVKASGSLFFNQSDNTTETESDLEYFEASLQGRTYEEIKQAEMQNYNLRFNMRVDYDINKRNKLQIRPKASIQTNDKDNYLFGQYLSDGEITNSTKTNSTTDTKAYNLGTEIDYKHAFLKRGQSLSVNLSGTVSNTNGDSYYDYHNSIYSNNEIEESNILQRKISESNKYSYKGNVAFTDQFWEKLTFQVNYKFSYSDDESDKKTYNKSPISDLYDQLDESLSNVSNSDYFTHSGGVSLRYRKGKEFSLMGGLNIQQAILSTDQEYPKIMNVRQSYVSFLPSMLMNYTINSGNSFRLQYRSNSSAPSMNDLQDVIDNTNPLMVTAGNPNLREQITHSSTLRYTRTMKSGQTFIAMIGGTIRSNYVSDSSFVAQKEMEIAPGVVLDKGAQFTKPVNMSGYYSMQGLFTYGFPVDLLKSNVNLSVSANYANLPNIFEGVKNNTRELNLMPKVVIGSNISEKIDFTISYSAGFNYAKSDLDNSESNQYFNHAAQAKFGWTIWKGITLGSTFRYISYIGLDENIDFNLLNASIAKRFLKNNAAEVKVEAFDLLRQNQAFNRNVGSNYYEYVTSNVLKPYVMLSFTYTLRPKVK
ncbi:MAG: outer membrane beta-barrel protein [Bacteroidales bacterium]